MASSTTTMNSAALAAPRVTSTSRTGTCRTARATVTHGTPARPAATATSLPQPPVASNSSTGNTNSTPAAPPHVPQATPAAASTTTVPSPSTSVPPRREPPSSASPLPLASENPGGMETDSAAANNEPPYPSSYPAAVDEWAQRAVQTRDFELLDDALIGQEGTVNRRMSWSPWSPMYMAVPSIVFTTVWNMGFNLRLGSLT